MDKAEIGFRRHPSGHPKMAVDTVAGVMQLSGFVPNSAAMSRAADIARRAEGVVQVQNKISVQP